MNTNHPICQNCSFIFPEENNVKEEDNLVMPEKNTTTDSKMPSSKCSCCPYGFHIDRDFVRYCDSLYNSAQLDKLRQHKRERRKEKKTVESYLGLGNLQLEGNNKVQNAVYPNSVINSSKKSPQEFCLHSEDLKNAVNDFEDTWKKSLKRSFSSHIIEVRNGSKQPNNHISHSSEAHENLICTFSSDDVKESKHHPSRSSSMSSVSSQSTSLSHINMFPSEDLGSSFVCGLNSSLSSLSKPLSNIPQQTVGIHKSVLTNIREQMASSLNRMKELEEEVKIIPALKGKLSALSKEKTSLLNELKLKENMITEAKSSKGNSDLENLLKKLENQGIMSPTLSRRCLSLQNYPNNLFSPAIASSLDATMIKKSFIEKEIISHLKMNYTQENADKNKKSIGTSCAVLTRDIGVGYVPNKYKSVGVGNDMSFTDSLNMFKKRQYEKQASISSESIESDLESLGGISDIPKHISEYQLQSFNFSAPKAYVDSSTHMDLYYVNKSVNTEKESSLEFNKKFPDKSVRHKSISCSPSVSSKLVQVSNKSLLKSVASQTFTDLKKDISLKKVSVKSVGVGDCAISDVLCITCKKPKKSVGVGLFDVKITTCDKCQMNKRSSLHLKQKNVSVGDFSIHWCCEKCESESELSKSSIGVNTSIDLSSSDRDIRICDKCSETIHSVAQDLAADITESSAAKFKSKEFKTKIPKSKFSKAKTEIQPLKIKQTKFEMNWSSEVKKETETVNEKSISKNISEKKDNENINIDKDPAEESPSSEILPNFTDLPVLPKKKRELSKEIKAACKVLNDHLQKSGSNGEKKMLSSLKIIQTEWFKVANQKKADPHLIEDYLDQFEEFSKLLLHKIVNLSDNNGNTALHYAVSYGNFDVVSILIDSKVCDVNIKNKAGYTSIMLVALAEMRNDAHHYVVQRLFSIGDINVKASQNGQTALMLGVSHGKKDIVKVLLDVGAEINLKDKDGSTALMCAAEHGHLEIAKILLSHPECDPTIVDNDGCNALTIAMEAGHKDIGLLIYTNMNFSRGSSPYSTLKGRRRSTPRSTPPPHTPTLRTPPLPSPATKSLNSLTAFQFPN